MFRSRASRILCCLCLLAVGLTPAAGAQKAPRVNARKLVRIAERAWSQTARAAHGKLDRRDPRGGAFWMSMDRMQASLFDVGTSLTRRDLSFFRALRSGSVALAQLGTVWARIGDRDPRMDQMDQEMRTLSAAYRQLRNRYGPEWVRFRTGKPLNDEERRRFERMRAEQARLAGRLEPLRDHAAATGDKTTAAQLGQLIVQAQSIAQAPLTLDDYLESSVLSDTIRGEWYGTRAANPTAQADWVQADDTVEEIYTDESVGFVFSGELDSGPVQNWDFVEEETELTQEIAGEGFAPEPDEIQAGQVLVFEGPETLEPFADEPSGDEEVAFEEMEDEIVLEGEEAVEAESLEAAPVEPGEATAEGQPEQTSPPVPLSHLPPVHPRERGNAVDAVETRPEPGASKSSDIGLATDSPATSPLSRRGMEGRWERGTGGEVPPGPPRTLTSPGLHP